MKNIELLALLTDKAMYHAVREGFDKESYGSVCKTAVRIMNDAILHNRVDTEDLKFIEGILCLKYDKGILYFEHDYTHITNKYDDLRYSVPVDEIIFEFEDGHDWGIWTENEYNTSIIKFKKEHYSYDYYNSDSRVLDDDDEYVYDEENLPF